MRTLLVLAALALGALPAQAAHRAIWTWEKDSYEMLESTAAAAAAEDFLRAKGIDTIFLYADSYGGRCLITEHPELYRAFIKGLHSRGMRAYALLGSAYLHTEAYVLPARRREAVAMLKRVLRYNTSAKPDERFDGVNLDIEPHILDEWDHSRNRLLLYFLDLGRALMAEKRRSGLTLKIGPAIPFWLDGIKLKWNGRLKPVSEHTQDIYDYVALMDYRDHAEGRDGMISHASDELAYARRRGRKVMIGVETTPNDIKKVSFNHLTEADMERELAAAEAVFAKEPAFAGFVIHHYRGYRVWLDKQAASGK